MKDIYGRNCECDACDLDRRHTAQLNEWVEQETEYATVGDAHLLAEMEKN